MAGGIAICLLLGSLLLHLAVRRRQRSGHWRGSVRLSAVVTALQYREAWQGKAEINDHKSSTEATLQFVDRGKLYEKCQQFPGILQTPAPGQRLPILFRRDSGEWILRKEARTHWCLLLVLGCACIATGLVLLLGGRSVLAELADYRVEAPNLAGSVVCALIGLASGAGACACIRGLMPDLIRTSVEPFVWMLRFYVLHRYEEIDALCIGILRRECGDDDVSYYPFFQYTVDGTPYRWFPRRQMSRKRYRPGNRYPLYRDPGNGRCALKPTALDLICAPFSLIPIGFFVMLTASLVLCAVGALYIAGIGFVYVLAA